MGATTEVGEVDRLRAQVYGLLARLLAKPPAEALLRQVAGLGGAAGGTDLGAALDELAGLAAVTGEAPAEREYNALFVGLERGELVPYASYYLTGFLHDRPLARLRQDMAALGIERAPGVAEPEDHVAAVCEIMAGLAAGELGGPAAVAGAPDQQAFFRRHLAPWAGRFFEDLEGAQAARLYRPLGRLGRLFVGIETDDDDALAATERNGARAA